MPNPEAWLKMGGNLSHLQLNNLHNAHSWPKTCETAACRPHSQGLAGGSNTLSDIAHVCPAAADKLDELLKTLAGIVVCVKSTRLHNQNQFASKRH